MLYVVFLCLIVLIISLICSKNIFSPSTIVTGVWLFCSLLYLILDHNLYSVSTSFIISISIWVIVFSMSSLFFQAIELFKTEKDILPNKTIRNLLVFISLIGFPFYLHTVYLVATSGYTENIWHNLRLANMGELVKYNIPQTTTIFSVLWFLLYIVELIYYDRKRILIVVSLFICTFSYSLLSVSKVNFFILFLGTVIVFYFKKIISVKHIVVATVILFVLFQSFQSIRSVSNDTNAKKGVGFVSLYLLSGMSAFGEVKPNSSDLFGENTFRFFYAISDKIGLTENKSVKIILEYVNVPVRTNVYTVLYPFYKDFGYIGVFIFAAVLGSFYGFLFREAVNGNNACLILYVYFIAIFALQFMNEVFFSTLSVTFQVLLFIFLLFLFRKKSVE